MIITTNILDFFCGLIEISAIIICLKIFGIYNISTIAKPRFIFAFFAYTGISILDFFLIGTYEYSAGFLMTILYFVKLLLPIFLIFGSIDLKIGYFTALMEFSVSFLSDSVTCIFPHTLETVPTNISPYVNLFVQIFIFVMLLLVIKKTDTKRVSIILKMIPARVFVLLLLTVLCLGLLVSLVSFNTDNYLLKENLLIAIIILLAVILAHIIMLLFLNVIAKQHFTVTSQMMEKQVELQISHYEELEKIDTEMRRFRHDYTNHLQSILSLIQMEAYTDAEEYIQKIKKTAYRSGAIMFYSGNKLADAILADKSALISENCRIDYSGIMPSSIANVDLCVILSNSLDNAIEACREINSPCTISVSVGEQQGYLVMSVKNPTAHSDSFYNIPPTSKSEKEQHGMGLYNIESAVKKNNGQMKIKCENGVFELMITMKL